MLSGLVRPAHSTPSHKQDSACWARHAIDRTRSGRCLGPRRTNTPSAELVYEPRPTRQWSPQVSAPRAPHRRSTLRAPHKPHPRRFRSSPNRHRKADPLSRRHGHRAASAESAAPSTTRRATNRAPTRTSSRADVRTTRTREQGQGSGQPFSLPAWTASGSGRGIDTGRGTCG